MDAIETAAAEAARATEAAGMEITSDGSAADPDDETDAAAAATADVADGLVAEGEPEPAAEQTEEERIAAEEARVAVAEKAARAATRARAKALADALAPIAGWRASARRSPPLSATGSPSTGTARSSPSARRGGAHGR